MALRFLPLGLAGLVLGANASGGWLAYVALAAMIVAGLGRPKLHAITPTTRGARLALFGAGLAHFGVLFSAVLALALPGGAGLGASLAAALASGLYLGQVSNAAAHELIHAPEKHGFWLGASIYASLMFGHHASAHRLVHHVHVATDADPNSAAAGTSLYQFLPRAWAGSYWAGLARERALRAAGFWQTPYPAYCALSLVSLAVSVWLAGWMGLVVHLGFAAYATLQLLTTDYVQHYGLRRNHTHKDKPEAVTERHSWDAPGFFAGWMTFNAPNHGAHHMRPATPYEQLTPGPAAMTLPYGLAVMGFIAFVPRWYRRAMKRPLEQAQALQA